MAAPTSLTIGARVLTSRGEGLVHGVLGAPGAEVVTVAFNLTLVDFPVEAVHPVGDLAFADIADIENFLADNPGQHAQAIEAFLLAPGKVRRPDSLGRSKGATRTNCSCACGKDTGCFRLSTAPDMHQENTGSCRCERDGCPCA